jgi:hypothetical protein
VWGADVVKCPHTPKCSKNQCWADEVRGLEHRFGSTYAHQLEKEIEELKHEVARNEVLIKIADELITNENAQKDWVEAKRTRLM